MTAGDQKDEFQGFSAVRGPAPPLVIDDALRGDWLDIWYQPKIDLRRKCLAGAEALVRMHHPQAGLLWPEDFLSALDEDGLTKLIEHALLATLRDGTIFADAGFDLRLAINVPAMVLLKLPIATLIAEHRPSSDKWPGLILEVAEDQIVHEIARTHKMFGELETCNVALAIDDFGAAYSSFSSLRDLPFAEIRLHGSFVKNCAADVTNAAICQTAIDLAHRFGSMAVAKDIESIADLQALMVMGCDFGQGMLVAPPMPKARFLDALRQHMNKSNLPQHSVDANASRVA